MNPTLKSTNLIRCLISRSSPRCILNHQFLNNNQLINEQKRTITRGRVKVLKEMKKRSKSLDVVPQKLRHRREWLDWNYDCEIYAFNQRLKEKFNELTLKKAFIFKSYGNPGLNQNEDLEVIDKIEFEHNEEFINIGSELCDRFVTHYLRFFFKNVPEEGIGAIKNFLLSEESLSDMATKIGCADLILCDEFPVGQKTLAKCIFSLVGALKHDTDEKHATKFIIDFILTYLYSVDIMDIWKIEDPEQLVESILKVNGISDFEYRLLRETGANTIIPSYLVGVYCNKKLLGFGPGSSILEAKQMAAYDCLRRMFDLNIANMVYKFGEQAYDLNFTNCKTPNPCLKEFRIKELDSFK